MHVKKTLSRWATGLALPALVALPSAATAAATPSVCDPTTFAGSYEAGTYSLALHCVGLTDADYVLTVPDTGGASSGTQFMVGQNAVPLTGFCSVSQRDHIDRAVTCILRNSANSVRVAMTVGLVVLADEQARRGDILAGSGYVEGDDVLA